MNTVKAAIAVALSLTIALALTACGPSTARSDSGNQGGVQSDSPSGTVQAASSSEPSELAYTAQIDKDSIMTFSISADPDAWQNMLDNATDEEYIPADITINGTMIENVGIRPKGNSSLSSVARDEDSDRYSFKIKFNEYVKGQKWLGLDKIVLNSNWSDATSMKEYLSYDMLGYVGVDVPLYSYADITVNGEDWGFYLAVEVIEDSYLERTHDGEGELYKPDSSDIVGNMPGAAEGQEGGMALPDMAGGQTPATSDGQPPATSDGADGQGQGSAPGFLGGQMPAMPWGDSAGAGRGGGGMGMGADDGVALKYVDDDESSYSSIFDNAQTDTDSSDHQRVIEAIKNLDSGTDLEKYVDVDATLRYFAALTVMVSLDSYEGSMGHNYYLYENGGQINILPWDFNMSFGGFQGSDAGSVVNFAIDTPVSGVSMEDRPLLSKLLEVQEYKDAYHGYIQEIIDGYFADGAFSKKVDELNSLIASHIESDPSGFYTYDQYQQAVSQLKVLGELRAQSVQGQLDGTIPSTSEGQEADSGALVDASSVELGALGGGMGGSPQPNRTGR